MNPAHLESLRHTSHQGICDHAQGLHGVLTESLDELLVLHFIFVVEGEEGLDARVRRVPELEARPTPARELLLRPYKRQPCGVRPPGRRFGQVIPQCRRSTGPIRGIGHLDVHLLLPLVRRRVVDGKVDHSRGRPLGRGWHLDCWRHCLHVGRWRNHPPFRLDRLLRWLVLLRLRLWPLRHRSRLWLGHLFPHLWQGLHHLS
jgi:hypothetical protein